MDVMSIDQQQAFLDLLSDDEDYELVQKNSSKFIRYFFATVSGTYDQRDWGG